MIHLLAITTTILLWLVLTHSKNWTELGIALVYVSALVYGFYHLWLGVLG